MSINKNGVMQCDICGRFISYSNEYFEWTYYASATVLEPPDPQHAHIKCYEKEHSTKEQKERMKRICWIRPVRVERMET